VRRLTLETVQQQFGGVLPSDAVLVGEGNASFVAGLKRGTEKTPPAGHARERRFPVFNAFVDVTLGGLTGAEARVWLVLFRDTKADTGTSRTGQTDIARRAGLGVRTVRRALTRLEGKGLVKVIRRGRLNGGPSVYRVFATEAADAGMAGVVSKC
jgi:Helix-turn-helix domain